MYIYSLIIYIFFTFDTGIISNITTECLNIQGCYIIGKQLWI